MVGKEGGARRKKKAAGVQQMSSRDSDGAKIVKGRGRGTKCKRENPPLKAATTLFRGAARADAAEAEGGPPEDGGFVEG